MTAIVLTLLVTPAAQASSSGATTPRLPEAVTSGEYPQGESAAESRRLATPQRAASDSTCRSARNGLRFYRSRFSSHRAKMGRGESGNAGRSGSSASPSTPRPCPYVRYLADRWRTKAHAARRAYERWAAVHVLRDPEVRPGNRAWHRAVQEAQRVYPGTRGWLLSCSASEGGWGRWVPNSDGAPPGGWLQFYESTFWRMWATAKVDVGRRGFKVPHSAHSWYSPLGQALAGAWGLTNGRRHEWAGYGC